MKKLWVGVFLFIGLGTLTIAQASDVGAYYWIVKRSDVQQTSTADPAPAGAPSHFFSLVEVAPGGQLMQLSNFVPPSGSVLGQQNYSLASDGSLQFDAYFSAPQSMDNAFHPGKYLLDLRGRTVNYLPKINLDASVTYPTTTPKLNNTNFQNGQLVLDATAQNTLTWNSFADHDANGLDAVMLLITNNNGNAVVLREVLPATTTSRTFAANFFVKDQTYIVDLSFVKMVQRNTTALPGSTGLTGYARATHIYVSTSANTPLNGLANISTRGLVGTGDDVLISGFIIRSDDGTGLTVGIRGIGPSLSGSGIVDPLQDPIVQLFDQNQQLIATSDDWKTTFPDTTQIHAVGLDPTDDRESALYRQLAPGRYTAVVRGKNNGTGIGLVEVYNLGSPGNAKLVNISTRGQVRTGQKVLIGGLIVQGLFPHTILLRALGPSITGVAGVLANPTLQLVNAQGTTIGFNNDWRSSQQMQIQATGAAPTDDHESAILQLLNQGRYTAIVAGRNDTTGVALVEAYATD